MAEDLVNAFWAKVKRGEPTECWLWTGYLHRQGYGYVRFNGRQYRTHRLAYELAYGVFPAELKVCHKCDNPPCCNPNHLFLGTHLDNLRDRDTKGRFFSKLTPDQVKEIRASYTPGEVTYAEIATRYGISASSVGILLSGTTWNSVIPEYGKNEGANVVRPRGTNEYREQMRTITKAKWADPEFRAMMLAARNKKI